MKSPLMAVGAIGVAALAAAGSFMALRGNTPGSVSVPAAEPREVREVAANGTVEGVRPEAALRAEVPGVLRVLRVRESDEVEAGAVLAELANAPQQHHISLARAELAASRQSLARLKNGERAEKRRAAAAAEQARKLAYDQAKADYQRTLKGSSGVSAQQRDADYFRVQQARAQWEEARAESELAEAGARPEDVAAAEAQVQAAEARLQLAEAELERTRIRAPCKGRVLQVLAEPGEAASPASAQPVLIMADVSRLRVRAFIEELDAVRVASGQAVEVTADCLPEQTFSGRVAAVLPRMGRRAPQSDLPTEYKDVHYREVLVDLDGVQDLPVNLRVQVRVRAGS